jgi:hypothetical protein
MDTAPAASPYRTVATQSLGDVAPAPNTFSDDEMAALEAANKRVARIPHEDGVYEIVIRHAQKLEWRKFRGSAHDEDAISDAQETLITQCVVAVAYEGEKAIGKDAARALLARLLNDWTAVCDDKKVSDLIKKLNSGVGARSPK